jgi:hypothetical protein
MRLYGVICGVGLGICRAAITSARAAAQGNPSSAAFTTDIAESIFGTDR